VFNQYLTADEVVWRAFESRPESVPALDPNGEYLRRVWRSSVYPLAEQLGVTMLLPPVQPHTGMRKISELLRLRVEHCNFGAVPVFFNINGRDVEVLPDHLLVEKSENRRPRTIPMTPRARAELLRVIQGRTEGPVFPARGRAST
jgi:integrase